MVTQVTMPLGGVLRRGCGRDDVFSLQSKIRNPKSKIKYALTPALSRSTGRGSEVIECLGLCGAGRGMKTSGSRFAIFSVLMPGKSRYESVST